MELSKNNVYIYSSNKFMIFTIREVLKSRFDCEVFCEPLPKEGIDEIFKNKSSDVVLFDAALLFDNKIRDTLNKRGALKVIALANCEIDYGLQHIISGYSDGMIDITYDVDIIELVINAVMKGFQCLPQIHDREVNLSSKLSQLTQREHEVLHYVSQGVSNKSIAEFLGVSYKTVCVHRYNIMYKLKVNNLSEFLNIKAFRPS
ncbi:LuxR C-terminal-related transcriptional regulator [Atlantibacter hermannii]|uniref:LuxR C-terminal-related transcriptional regulator n=1 Tax=Atlantibacter hermannii TaxID=565 RepID=UPI0028AA0EDD|nr:LuxR C-terminal-related transcriptional regulator [Atlantibacter hermannii]